MTIQQELPNDEVAGDTTTRPAPTRRRSTPRPGSAVDRAYQRRDRRQARIRGDRLTDTGSPVHSALARVPFVLTVMVLLAGGITAVLWLTTLTDEAGINESTANAPRPSCGCRSRPSRRWSAPWIRCRGSPPRPPNWAWCRWARPAPRSS